MKIRTTVAVLLIGLVLAGCDRKPEPSGSTNTGGSTAAPVPAKKFVVAIPTYPGFAIPFLAQNNGLFGDVEVELKRIDDAGIINSGMIKGDIDACFTSTDAFVLAASQGVDAQAVLLSDESLGADGIVAKKSITSVADLRGKTVAANLGWPGHFFLLYNLKKAGIPFDEVPITNMDADKAGAAFVSGNLDAAVTWEPWLSKATSEDGGHVLLSTRDMPKVIVDVMLVRSETVKQNPAAVQAFVNGYYKALAMYQADAAATTPIMAEALGLPAEDFTAMTEGFRFIPAKEAAEMLAAGGAVGDVFDTAADIWLEAGLIEKSVPTEQRVNPDFVEAYLEP